MSETLDYIEAYFEKKLSPEEKQVFEQRCIDDKNFAGDVAFYITSREAVRQELLEQKKEQWANAERDITHGAPATLAPVKKMMFKKWLPYAVAAGLLVAVCIYFLFPPETPRQFADTYIQQNLTVLSLQMDGSSDSVQSGLAAYNRGAYDSAVVLFENVYTAYPENSEVKKYIGLSYLMKKDYGKALLHFEELRSKKLFSNPGAFLKAVTLLERNGEGDKDAAKALLEQVKGQQLEHRKEAEEWLKKW
ncbi:MAG TPA: hypothetical protein VEY10_17515 [Flavisolibacter sp.]|nr:hypothetical protein [Flavisolibacter sp.]